VGLTLSCLEAIHGFVWFLFGVAPARFVVRNRGKNAQLCFWIQRWTCAHEVDRVEKARKAQSKNKGRGSLEEVSGLVAGHMVGDVAVVAPTKAKAREDKGN